MEGSRSRAARGFVRLGLAGVGAALLLLLHTVAGAAAEEDEVHTVTFRVMTYNIHHARGMDDEVDVGRIAEVINRENPAIVALQEVDRGTTRTAGRDLPAELAETTGMEVAFGPNLAVQGGDYGNAILTRFHLLDEANTQLPNVGGREQRGVQHAVLDVGGVEVLFMNTHLDHRSAEARLLGVARMHEIARERQELPVIMCGDFNALPGSATYERVAEHFLDVWNLAGEGEGFTYRSDNPHRRIDYIWISDDDRIAATRAWVGSSLASDHLPLTAELELAVPED